ncbi:MAG: type II toxin-antitoxin system YafQ family toxin [Ruminococcus sp.]|nr:type II toxin-antitoxin system YafQ family toxin [Ruminococcus sp.]
MYEIQYTNRFKKSMKLCAKRGLDTQLVFDAVDILQKEGELPQTYRPHILSGRYEGYWECHIKGDWLLIWKQDDDELIIVAVDTGTHSDIFG